MMLGRTSLGLTPSLTAALAYVLGFVSGFIVFVLEKDNRFVRFHSMQSVVLSLAFLVLYIAAGFVPVMEHVLGKIVSVIGLICWLTALFKAARGQYYKLPIIGEYAEKQI